MTSPAFQPPVTGNDIAAFMQIDVIDEQAQKAIQLAAGWIIGRTSFTAIPDAVPQDVWADWLELSVLSYDNPTMMISNQAGMASSTWGSAPAQRVEQILTNLSRRYPFAEAAPLGNFPPALAGTFDGGYWPDDARATLPGSCFHPFPWDL